MIRHVISIPPHFAQVAGRNGETREDKKRIYQRYVEAYVERQGMEVLKIKKDYAICKKKE